MCFQFFFGGGGLDMSGICIERDILVTFFIQRLLMFFYSYHVFLRFLTFLNIFERFFTSMHNIKTFRYMSCGLNYKYNVSNAITDRCSQFEVRYLKLSREKSRLAAGFSN